MSTPRRYAPHELTAFLKAVEARLTSPAKMIVMGGGAIALAYGIEQDTSDIDTWATDLREIKKAVAQAQKDTGLHVPVSERGGAVGDVPQNSEQRFLRVLPELRRLEVYALEAHDIALSKT